MGECEFFNFVFIRDNPSTDEDNEQTKERTNTIWQDPTTNPRDVQQNLGLSPLKGFAILYILKITFEEMEDTFWRGFLIFF